MKKRLATVLAVVLLALSAGCASYKMIKIPEKLESAPEEAVLGMKSASAVFLGEVHDNKDHHRLQLDMIRRLDLSGARIALGLEMFGAQRQKELDRWVFGEMDEDEFREVYYKGWLVPWSQYRDIFMYAREKKIPLVGLNIAWSIIRQVVKGGVKSLSAEDSKGLEGLRCDADAHYEKLIRDAMSSHAHHANGAKDTAAGDAFRNFCEAQMVWDTVMARRIAEYLKENPDRTVVVLAGGAHAWKRGIPRSMLRLMPGAAFTYVVVMPEITEKLRLENVDASDTDYLWVDP